MQMEEPPPIKENRYRRSYSKAFKAALVERCLSGEASIAVIAREHGLNANLLQKWVSHRRREDGRDVLPSGAEPKPSPARWIALEPAAGGRGHIKVEVSQGGTGVTLHWPASDPAGLAQFVRALLA